MEHSDLKSLIDDIEKLCIIPNLYDCIFHKIEELKHRYVRDLQSVQKVLDELEKKMKINPTQAIPIKLILVREKWQLQNEFDAIPRAIIDYITENASSTSKLDAGLHFDGERYHLGFQKESQNCITGVIVRQTPAPPKNIDFPITVETLEEGDIKKFKNLLRLCLKYPDLKKSIFEDIELKLPFLDSTAK